MKELLEKILGQIKKTPYGVRAYEDLYHICLETQKTDIPLSVEYLKKLSDIIENRIPQSETDKELRSLFMLHKKVLLAAAPFDFESYLLYVEWERKPDKKFYVPRREVMHPVVQAMQDLIDDRLDLLTISMPPGTGKSTLGIFFLSWVMGRFPDSQSLASAHSGMLTRSFYDGVYQIITDSEYLWADVFPGVKMAATNSKEETIDLHKKHRFSTLTCRAINASLTGATRCDKILYADDLCSGIEEAMSKERLDKLWSAYTNDLKSRKKEGAKEIHIATRWSVHDIIGRLENQYGGDSRAKFIVLPALDVSIQAQVVNLMKDIQQETGTAYLFIAHDLSMVKYISDRIGVLHLGHLLETGTTEEIFENPIHPYTKSLLSAIPAPNPVVEKNRVALSYDYKTSGIDYNKGTDHLVSGTHYVKCTDEEFKKWTE